MDPFVADGLNMVTVLPDDLALCRRFATNNSEECQCMQFSKKRMAELEIIGAPQHRMWCKLFVLLHSSDGVCLSVQGLVARIIEALAYHIEERFDAFLQSRMGPPSADDIKRGDRLTE